MDCSHIARNIRAARTHWGFSQETLAERADLPLGIIMAAERGEDIGVAELHSIALALHVDLRELFSEDELDFGPPPLWCNEQLQRLQLQHAADVRELLERDRLHVACELDLESLRAEYDRLRAAATEALRLLRGERDFPEDLTIRPGNLVRMAQVVSNLQRALEGRAESEAETQE